MRRSRQGGKTMRERKTIKKEYIKEVYGNWAAIKTELPMAIPIRKKGSSLPKRYQKMEQYYYRYKGQWYPTSRNNLVKRGIIK
jgi:hypothetical protein